MEQENVFLNFIYMTDDNGEKILQYDTFICFSKTV